MGNSSIVRVSNKTKETIAKLAKRSGEPMLYVIDKAIEEYRRRVFLEETNRAYAALRANEKASKEYDEEIAAWDTTLMDGIDRGDHGNKGNAKASKKKGRRK